MRRLSLLIAVVLPACSSPSTVAPVSVPLSYQMQAKPLEFPSLAPCSAVSKVEVVDGRSDKAIGKRYLEEKKGQSAAVTAATDVVEWVRAGVEEGLRRAGVATGTSGAPVLHVTIEQISTLENVLHRSGYEGRVTLSVELRSTSGNSCFKDRPDGFSENYGYSGSAENYRETLNHALDRTMIRLLSSSDFKQAVCKSC